MSPLDLSSRIKPVQIMQPVTSFEGTALGEEKKLWPTIIAIQWTFKCLGIFIIFSPLRHIDNNFFQQGVLGK